MDKENSITKANEKKRCGTKRRGKVLPARLNWDNREKIRATRWSAWKP